MRRPERVFVGLGANLGDPADEVRRALAALGALGPVRASSLYQSEPQDGAGPAWYVNAVAELPAALEPRALLAELQALERAAGRPAEHPPNAPRSLDLDLLLYGVRVIDEPGLQVPHPRYRRRRFVLVPLLELAPDLIDPVDGKPLAQVLADLDDPFALARL
jgi:2-amino-4-hydroxy-6-hydroxymethyldihydropteridine diphosphokinase